jgi:hypothetical protein
MPLHQLYLNASGTGSLNPSYKTGLQPGGAGVQVSSTSVNPGISSPRLEESTIEVLDVTAPTLLAAAGTANASQQLCLPAPQGKLLVMDSITGAFGARWKLNATVKQAIPRGQFGIVYVAGAAQTLSQGPPDAGYAVSTSAGNEAQYGTKAVVMYDGPISAFCQTSVGGIAISAGMPLSADGAGNLTAFSGTPNAGTVLGTYADATLATSTSVPVLRNIYVGGY